MPKFTVDVKAFINVTVEADNEDDARLFADEWVEAMPRGISYVGPIKSATVSVDGESDVEGDDSFDEYPTENDTGLTSFNDTLS